MTITLETEKETRDTFVKEVEKDELELLIRRTTNIEIPKGWELTDEVFKKLDGELVSNGDEWIDSDRWDWNDSYGEMFGELDEYIYEIIELMGFRKRKVKNPNYDPKKETYSFSNQKVIEEWYLPSKGK